jgi:sugar lactone lactonase YvrE
MSFRPKWLLALAAFGAAGWWAWFPPAWGERTGRLDAVWGRRGLLPGDFIRPRALATDRDGNVVAVDFRAAIQVFAPDGRLLRHWRTPDHRIGRPSGLCVDADGNILVADSHYHQVLVYSSAGELLRSYGGDQGQAPLVGEFGYIADMAVDSHGYIYIAEAQQKERITKIDRAGNIVAQWGERGVEPGQFQRIRSLYIDALDRLYAADACNHRIQIMDASGKVLQVIGGKGVLDYPFDVIADDAGNVFTCEWGANAVKRFAPDGKLTGAWGEPGSKPGQLRKPWALALDFHGRVLVADTDNHRIQCVRF